MESASVNAANNMCIVTVPGAAGASAWVHGAGFASYQQARDERNSRLEELRRRWDERERFNPHGAPRRMR